MLNKRADCGWNKLRINAGLYKFSKILETTFQL